MKVSDNEVPVDTVVFTTIDVKQTGIEVTFGLMYPRTCPPSLRHCKAGLISRGVFYPYGSVSKHFFLAERESRNAA